MTENVIVAENTEINEAAKQLTLQEAQIQACMCMNRILYLTQDPEINSFFVSYIADFSDFDPGYKSLMQELLTTVAPSVGLQINNTSDNTPTPLAWGYEANINVEHPDVDLSEVATTATVSLHP